MSTPTYKDKDGKEYTYHVSFSNTEDDLVILSKDDIAFRIDSLMLRAASPVFRAMMLTCDNKTSGEAIKDSHVSLDYSSQTLEIFLSAILDLQLELMTDRPKQLKEALDMCDEFQVGSISKRVLKYMCPVVKYDKTHLYELFVLAGRYDDLDLACKVLAQGWRSERWDNTPLDPTKWNRQLACQLPGDWVWALSTACRDTPKSSKHDSDEEYRKPFWIQVVGRSVNNLHTA